MSLAEERIFMNKGNSGKTLLDPIQGGAGTSLNMNVNEVIANRAIECLGGQKGDYSIVNPNDHVNCSQSTNDVIPTAGKMTSLRLLQHLKAELLHLHTPLCQKAEEFDYVIKIGRTQMQDAVPIRLGQEFHVYSVAIHQAFDLIDVPRTWIPLWSCPAPSRPAQ